MTTALMLYLYMVVGNIIEVGGFISVISAIAWGVASGISWVEKADEVFKLTRKLRWVPYVALLFIIANALLPTKEQLAWIIGGSVAVSIASTEEAKQLPENVLGAVNSFLKQMQEDEGNE